MQIRSFSLPQVEVHLQRTDGAAHFHQQVHDGFRRWYPVLVILKQSERLVVNRETGRGRDLSCQATKAQLPSFERTISRPFRESLLPVRPYCCSS